MVPNHQPADSCSQHPTSTRGKHTPSVVSVPQVEVFTARPTCPETSLGSGVTSFPQENWAKSGEITEITMENLGMAPNIAKMGEKNREKKT